MLHLPLQAFVLGAGEGPGHGLFSIQGKGGLNVAQYQLVLLEHQPINQRGIGLPLVDQGQQLYRISRDALPAQLR